jgi:hypothetical protein
MITATNIDQLLQQRRRYQQQLQKLENDPQQDTKIADLVCEIDHLDRHLLDQVPASICTTIKTILL